MDALVLIRFTAVCRLSIGASFLTSPGRFMRAWIGRDAGYRGAGLLARALGSRDVLLAAGTLTAANRHELRRWTAAGLLADATDLSLTLAARRRLPRRNVALVSAIAGAGVLLGAAALSSRPREHSQPSPPPAGPASPDAGAHHPAAPRRAGRA